MTTVEIPRLYKRINLVVEDIENYREGGFHPVMLGDTLMDKRYTILRKLGYGTYSTVWLARDERLSKLRAIKICTASTSADPESEKAQKIQKLSEKHSGREHLLFPFEVFKHVGPNGIHDCLVMDIMIDPFKNYELCPPHLLKKLAYQMLLALDCLHQCGYVHSDVRIGNILQTYPNTDLSEETVLSGYPKQSQSQVQRLDGEPVGEHAPAYLISADSEFVEGEDASVIAEAQKYDISESSVFKLIDLGTCFPRDQKQNFFATPKGVKAPELIFDFASPEIYDKMDIWALGCTLYELLVGHSMFIFGSEPIEVGDAQARQLQVLSNMIDRLGPVPPEVTSKLGAIKDCVNDDGRLKDSEATAGVQSEDITPLSELLLDGVKKTQRSWDMEVREVKYSIVVRAVPENERNNFQDLLLKMMDWDAAKRPTAEELLKHSWFTDLP